MFGASQPGLVDLDDADLMGYVVELQQARARSDAEEARALAELERRGACDATAGLSTTGWVAREGHLPAGVARSRVRVATMLQQRFPVVLAALEAGRISWDHARVIVDLANPRIADVVVDNQDLLLSLADGCRFEPWRAEVLALGRLWDQDGGYDPTDDPTRARLSHARTIDGLTTLIATLTGTDAEMVTQAIEATADHLYRRAATDAEACPELAIPSRSTLRAMALVQLVREALGTDHSTSKPARPELTLVVEADHADSASTPDGVRLSDGSTRAVRCDADLLPLIVDSLGIPLDLGRRIRLATEAQRRAIRSRDGGCAFPGCDAPHRWCEAHHCVPWSAEHGRTDCANLVSLCRHHHSVVHREGWSARLDLDGWAIFQTPTGDGIWGQRHGRRRDGPPPLVVRPPEPPPPVYPGRYHRPEDPHTRAETRQTMLHRLRASAA